MTLIYQPSYDPLNPRWYTLLCQSDEKKKVVDNDINKDINKDDNLNGGNNQDDKDLDKYEVAVEVSHSERKRRRTRSLLDDHKPETLKDELLVKYITPENKRYFTIFRTYLDFAKYLFKLKPEKRCFFETILGDRPQKPHFDIDINTKEHPDISGSDVIDELIFWIYEVLEERNVMLDLNRDVLLFQSHGPDKFSYHVVIDNYMHVNNLEAKAFYQKIVSKMDPVYAKFVDHAVYSSKQQFRIVFNQKVGSGRIKTFCPKWKYQDDEVEYVYRNTPRDNHHEMVLLLEASLVTQTSACYVLPNFLEIDERGRIGGKSNSSYFDEDISIDVAKGALEKLANKYNMSSTHRRFPYKILDINGGIVSLRRIYPSKCQLCNRVHENENPYIFIIGENRNIYFNCRRNDKNLYVGGLGPTYTISNDLKSCTDEELYLLSLKNDSDDDLTAINISGYNIENDLTLMAVTPLNKFKNKGTDKQLSVNPFSDYNLLSKTHLNRILEKMSNQIDLNTVYQVDRPKKKTEYQNMDNGGSKEMLEIDPYCHDKRKNITPTRQDNDNLKSGSGNHRKQQKTYRDSIIRSIIDDAPQNFISNTIQKPTRLIDIDTPNYNAPILLIQD